MEEMIEDAEKLADEPALPLHAWDPAPQRITPTIRLAYTPTFVLAGAARGPPLA